MYPIWLFLSICIIYLYHEFTYIQYATIYSVFYVNIKVHAVQLYAIVLTGNPFWLWLCSEVSVDKWRGFSLVISMSYPSPSHYPKMKINMNTVLHDFPSYFDFVYTKYSVYQQYIKLQYIHYLTIYGPFLLSMHM